MNCHRIASVCLALSLAALVASPTLAGLVVTVTRDATPGQTLWQFSGSSTYTQIAAGGKFAGGPVLDQEWKGSASSDYVVANAYGNYTTSRISGAIGLSVKTGGSETTAAINWLHIDHESSGDDFGVGVLGDDLPLLNGDIVSWVGSAVFAVDITKLNPGVFSFLNYGSSQAGSGTIYGTLPMTLNVAIPEIDPSSLSAVVALVVGTLSLVERRRAIAG